MQGVRVRILIDSKIPNNNYIRYVPYTYGDKIKTELFTTIDKEYNRWD